MDMNAEYLNYIYQNTEMGVKATQDLMEVIVDKQTLEHLQKQVNDYQDFNSKARQMLHDRGHEEKDIPAMKRVMSYFSINVQTMVDRSPVRVAEMMMQGSTMGIIDITKNLKKYEGADPEIVDLGKKLLKFEEDSFSQWKLYLSITVA